MVKGRNTSVLTVRVADELAVRLRSEAKKRKLLLNDYLKSILVNYWQLPTRVNIFHPTRRSVTLVEQGQTSQDIDGNKTEPSNLEKDPGYRKDTGMKFEAKYSGTPRNAPCPCGAKNPDGSPKKYKRCHGRFQ